MEIIDTIMTQAYKQEMNLLNPIVKKILQSKTTNVICIHKDLDNGAVIIERVLLQELKSRDNETIAFRLAKQAPSLEDTLEMLNLKKS